MYFLVMSFSSENGGSEFCLAFPFHRNLFWSPVRMMLSGFSGVLVSPSSLLGCDLEPEADRPRRPGMKATMELRHLIQLPSFPEGSSTRGILCYRPTTQQRTGRSMASQRGQCKVPQKRRFRGSVATLVVPPGSPGCTPFKQRFYCIPAYGGAKTSSAATP